MKDPGSLWPTGQVKQPMAAITMFGSLWPLNKAKITNLFGL